jgi:endonuclease YncB( thermonuclease family)
MFDSSPNRSVPAVALLLFLAISSAASSDQWLIYLGEGMTSIEGGWTEKRGQILFTSRGGVLVSVPAHDVDLPASSFITWQLDGRLRTPPRASLPEPYEKTEVEAPCKAAKLLRLVNSETMEVTSASGSEVVHLACFDAPDAQHRLAELAWFGRAAFSAMEIEVGPGSEVCVTEHSPARRDREGHRIVHVTLPDGRDYAEVAIANGFGMLRPGSCDRASRYRGIEDRAIAGQRGLWGARAERAALAAVGHSIAVDTGPGASLPRRRSGGG